MRARTIIILVICVLGLVILAIPFICHVTGYAPMVAMPVKITRGGLSIPAEEIVSLQYAFSEKSTTEERAAPSLSLQDARTVSEGFYLVQAPFSVSGPGLFYDTTTAPLYHSLRLRLVLRHGGCMTMIYPVLSDTKLNQAIYVDLPSLP